MANDTSELHARIESGGQVLVAELSPPKSGDGAQVRERAKHYAGKVHALGMSDNRDGAAMSALAAASLVQLEGVEAILHVVTRDRNRIALVSECLGAHALGIRNILCTTGTHQTLGPARSAKNVFDLDSIQLLQIYTHLAEDGSVVGEECYHSAGPFCLGATTSQHADPVELQTIRLGKKAEAGAQFVITEPVFDVEIFETFWNAVTKLGLHERVAILAGVRPLTDVATVEAFANSRPDPRVPEEVVKRLVSKNGATERESEGIALAVETVERLSGMEGLRGFSIEGGDNDQAAISIIEQCGLGVA
jgi:methylenetetrahydrofolate reductase (NADPH)